MAKYGEWETEYGIVEDWATRCDDGRWVLENGWVCSLVKEKQAPRSVIPPVSSVV
ncbi:MAG: hypothetical protein AAFV85_23135 [Cyanobacteria bacterium J06634_6]